MRLKMKMRGDKVWKMRGKWKATLGLAALAFTLSLSGCAPRVPVGDLWGNPWSEDWEMVGDVVGVENTPGLTLSDSVDVLAGDGLYYGSWVGGEAQTLTYEDEKGKEQELEVYEGQVYLLVGEKNDHQGALEDVEQWLEGARQGYQLTGEEEWEIGEALYQVLYYDLGEDAAPLTHGISAFAALDQYALCAELTYQDSYTQDVEALLRSFLEHCHLAAFE